MKLRLYRTKGRYAFSLDSFSSIEHYALVPNIKATYQYAWEAMRDAKRIYRDKFSTAVFAKQKCYAGEDLSKDILSDPPAEELLLNHYKSVLSDMSKKVMGIDDNTEEEKKMTYLVIKSQVEDLLRIKDEIKSEKTKVEIDSIINSYRKITQDHFQAYLNKDKAERDQSKESAPEIPMPFEEGAPASPNLTMASKKIVLTGEELQELMEDYGNKVCSVIAKHHPDVICKVFPEDGSIKILGLSDGKEMLDVHMNDNFVVDRISPCGSVAETYPSYTPTFYQRYWKPVVEALGHFFLEEMESLILPQRSALPDMPNGDGNFDITGWSPMEEKAMPLSLSFKNKTPIWLMTKRETIVKTAAEYTAEDFLRTQPSRVRCIDEKLQSLYGKVGEVVQVIPIDAGIGFEIDVNFGRKIVRLSQKQVEIVDDI